jgi:glycosyltransferase involved in cell wall biosynthesis
MKRYLPKFLEELPKQTLFPNFEIVLDHNEPDDEEIGWVKAFQQKYPGVIRHIIIPKVDPIGISMNRCIQEAQSEYVAIWNVDDLRTPDSLEKQVVFLDTHPDRGVVYGSYRVVRSFGVVEGKLVNDGGFAPHDNEFKRSMLLGPFFMFRKKLVEKAGWFDEQLRSGADFDLAIRLAFHAAIGYVDGLLGYYLNEGKGASTRPGSLQAVERTVIELRYGMYDKIDYEQVPKASGYFGSRILKGGEWKSVAAYVPNYVNFLSSAQEFLVKSGIRRFITGYLLNIRQMKSWLKRTMVFFLPLLYFGNF